MGMRGEPRDVAYGVTVRLRARGFDRPGSVPQYVARDGVHPVYVGESEDEARQRIGEMYGCPAADVRISRWGL